MEKLTSTEVTLHAIPWVEMGIRLLAAFVGGVLVITIYKGTRPASAVSPSFPPTLVLLAIVIAMVTQVIGDQLARAFSLVGALSIVRFRTVVRDTQDTAFVIFAVVVGMAAGTGNYAIAGLGLIVCGLAALLIRAKADSSWSESENTLNLRIGLGADAKALLKGVFDKHIQTEEMLAVMTVQKGVALDYAYRVRLKAGSTPDQVVKELNQLDGVQSVELRHPESNAD